MATNDGPTLTRELVITMPTFRSEIADQITGLSLSEAQRRLRDRLVVGIRSENNWHVGVVDDLITAVEAQSLTPSPAPDPQTALDRLAAANAHRLKLWLCPDCHTRCRVENAPNHADSCEALQRAAALVMRQTTTAAEILQHIEDVARREFQVFAAAEHLSFGDGCHSAYGNILGNIAALRKGFKLKPIPTGDQPQPDPGRENDAQLSPEQKLTKARQLQLEASREIRRREKCERAADRCHCGHRRDEHAVSTSINYTEGFCMTCPDVKGAHSCQWFNFKSEGAEPGGD